MGESRVRFTILLNPLFILPFFLPAGIHSLLAVITRRRQTIKVVENDLVDQSLKELNASNRLVNGEG